MKRKSFASKLILLLITVGMSVCAYSESMERNRTLQSTDIDGIDSYDSLALCRSSMPCHYGDSVFHESGDYVVHFASGAGSDSVVMLHLVVHENVKPDIYGLPTRCSNVSASRLSLLNYDRFSHIMWSDGSTNIFILTADTFCTVSTVDFNGCQGRDTFRIAIIPELVITYSSPTQTCYGDTLYCRASGAAYYSWMKGSQLLSESDTYVYIPSVNQDMAEVISLYAVGENNCTVDDTLVFRTFPVYDIAETTYLCPDEFPYHIGPYTIDSVGDYRLYYSSVHGCDSFVSMSVRIKPNPVKDTAIYRTVCRNSLPYVYNGVQYYNAGIYDIHFTPVYGCDSIVHLNLAILENPIAYISGNTGFCEGGTTTLTAIASGPVQWNTGSTSSALLVASEGQYVLTVTGTNGCISRDTAVVIKYALPTITIEGPSSCCKGSQLTLTASGAHTYSWNTGAIGASILVSPGQETTYIVTGTSPEGCISSASQTVTVNPLPEASITGNNVICEGNIATFTAHGGVSYRWSTGATTALIQCSQPQVYTVEVTSDRGCSSTVSKELVVNPMPTIQIDGPSSICEGRTATLTASGSYISSIQWSTGEVGLSIVVSNQGHYYALVTSPSGCMASAEKILVGSFSPVVNVTGELTFCSGESTTLTATGGISYVWKDMYDNEVATTPTATILHGGRYSVVASNENACTASKVVTVVEKNLPNATIISDKNAMCPDDSATLTAGYASGYSYRWTNGSTERQIKVGDGRLYSVIVTENGCSALTSTRIQIHNLPVISLTGDTDICIGDTTVIKASSPIVVSYLWSTLSTDDSITVSPNTTTSYSLNVVDIHNCYSDTAVQVNVHELPVPYIIGLDSMCVGDSVLLTAGGGSYYLWNDGCINSERYVTEASAYSVEVKNEWFCRASASKTVEYFPIPVATITGERQICGGDSTVLVAHGGVRYLWSTMSEDSSIVVDTAGLYSVRVWDIHSCMASDSIQTGMYDNPQVMIVGDSVTCDGDSVMLLAVSNVPVSFMWNNGSQDSLIRVCETAAYQVVVTDSNHCHSTDSLFLLVNPLPVCSIEGDSIVCRGDTITLTASGGVSYIWSTGDTTQSIQIIPDSSLTVSVTVFDENTCSDIVYKDITVIQLTPVYIEGEEGFCMNDSTLLVAYGATDFVWNTGHRGDSLMIVQGGTYSVAYVDEHACVSVAYKTVEQYELPMVDIQGPQGACMGETVQLKAVAPTAVSYSWNVGGTDSVISVIATNVYRVTVTDMRQCTNTAASLLVFYSEPQLNLMGPSVICHDDSVVLRAITTEANHYMWNTGDTTSAIKVSPLFNTTYSVVVSNDYGCSNEASLSIAVNPKPALEITGDTNMCEGQQTTLTATVAASYRWSTGSHLQSILVTEAGYYTVVVTNGMGCTNSATAYVTVHDYPQPSITAVNSVCSGEEAILVAMGGVSYHWNTGEDSQIITVNPTATTTYSVSVSNGYCSATATHTLTVYPKPTPVIASNNYICENSNMVLTAQGGVYYQWSTGEYTPSIVIDEGGTYWLRATSEYGCIDTVYKTIQTHESPMVSILGPSAMCEGETISLTASGAGRCLWNTGDTTASLLVSASGEYIVTLTDAYACTASASRVVTAHPLPTVNILGSHQLCQMDTITLSVECVNAETYRWNTGSTASTIQISPAVSTDYSVLATSSYGCTAEASHSVQVHDTYISSFADHICAGNGYNQHGFNIPVQHETGVFRFTQELQSVYGCDSLIVLVLTVKSVPVIEEEIIGNGYIVSPGSYVFMISEVEEALAYEWIISNPQWTLNFNHTVAQLTIPTPGTGNLQVYAINACGQSLPKSKIIVYGSAVEEYDGAQLRLYPNPSDSWLHLDMGNRILTQGEIQIVDLTGRILYRSAVSGSTDIDVSSMAQGVYLLQLFNESQACWTAKFVKM